jgi:hypothetical protein
VRRIASIPLLICFAFLGTGLAEHLHDLHHEREDAAIVSHEAAEGRPAPLPPQHDDSNCAIHAQLHLPLTVVLGVPLLICLGLLIAFLTPFAQSPVSLCPAFRLDCRGPPAC